MTMFNGRNLVAAAIILAGISGVAAEAVKAQVRLPAKEVKDATACQENLMKLDGATEQFALEYRQKEGAKVTMTNLLDPAGTGKTDQGYLRRKPVCPAGGTYKLPGVGSLPECSVGAAKGHALDVKLVVDESATSATATR